ncbi:amidohydrolase [Candidatus Woesearchaeota archaeon]|nr:amidohydrolase [Candidatus Woesearchaeota archaeon]
MLLKNCRYIVTQNGSREVLENKDILIEDNKIVKIGEDLGEGLDCSEKIVMPGLINAHTHLGMTSLRGVSDDKELAEWLEDIWAREAKLSEEDIKEGKRLGIKEALRTGTTTVVDMYFRMGSCAEVAEKEGIRYLGAVTFLEDHPLSPATVELPKDISSRVQFCYGPHAIYSTSEDMLKQIKNKSSGKLIHIHVAETRKERADCKEKHGKLPVEYLESIGFLDENVTMAHCVWLTKGELDIIARKKAKVVHCPQSNMKLSGGGVMPLNEMQERGIVVALGTDSVASNNSLDMFREMHVAALLHKHHYWDPATASAQIVLDMATVNGAVFLGRDDIGSIEEGKLADIVTLNLNDENLQPHDKERIVSHLVYAANGMNVSDVIVDGKLISRPGRP